MSLKDQLTGKTAREIETIAGYALDGLEAIASLTGNGELTAAASILSGIETIAHTVIAGVAGDITAAEVDARIPKLKQAVADDNAAADAAAAAKFGKPTP